MLINLLRNMAFNNYLLQVNNKRISLTLSRYLLFELLVFSKLALLIVLGNLKALSCNSLSFPFMIDLNQQTSFILKWIFTTLANCKFVNYIRMNVWFDQRYYWKIHDIINNPANTQRWFNVDICWNIITTSVIVISTLIHRRFVNVDPSIKFNVEKTLILGWL